MYVIFIKNNKLKPYVSYHTPRVDEDLKVRIKNLNDFARVENLSVRTATKLLEEKWRINILRILNKLIFKIILFLSIFLLIFNLSTMSSKRRVGVAHFLLQTYEMLEVRMKILNFKDPQIEALNRVVFLWRVLLHKELQRVCKQGTLIL